MAGQADAHVFSVNFHWQEEGKKMEDNVRKRQNEQGKQRSVFFLNKIVGMAPWE